MLEQLFGSKTRVKLMRVFLDNPEKKFFVRELTRLTDSLINSVRRELENLVDMKLVKVQEIKDKDKGKGLNVKRFYYLNSKNLFQKDLISLFSKGKIFVEKKFIERIKRLGDVKYLSLGGFFIEDDKAKTDVLIVGKLDRDKAADSLAKFEKQIKHAIRYTIMDEDEFKLRQDITDRFLEDIIDNEANLVVVDSLKNTRI